MTAPRNHDGLSDNQPRPPMIGARAAPLTPSGLLDILWSARWIVIGCTLLSILVTAAVLRQTPVIYSGISRVYVAQETPRILGNETEAQKSKNYLYTQAAVIASQPILSAVIDTIRTDPNIADSLPALFDRKDLNHYLQNNLTVKVGKRDDLIEVIFDSPDPRESAEVVNAFVNAYIAHNEKQNRNTSSEIVRILQHEKDQRGREMLDKLRIMMDFRKAHEELIFTSKNGNIVVEGLARLSDAMIQAQLASIEAMVQCQSRRSSIDDPLQRKALVEGQRSGSFSMSVSDNSTILRGQLNQVRLQREELLRAVTPDHPSVAAIDRKIDQLQRQIDALDESFAQSQLALAEQQWTIARQKEQQIRSQFDQQRLKALEVNEQYAQYLLLESDWEQTRRICEVLDERIKEINITEETGALNISVLEPAVPPRGPSRPRRARILAMALFAGCFLGIGLGMLRDLTDPRFHTIDEMAAVTGLPVLGVIPFAPHRRIPNEAARIVELDRASPTAQVYRKLRTASFTSADQKRSRVLLAASCNPREGRTTTACNLALAMAQAGHKTLLVGTDYRHPDLSEIFAGVPVIGLSEVVSGEISLPSAVMASGIEGLAILDCGSAVDDPSMILDHDRFASVIRILACQFDRLILDSPPMSKSSDALSLAAVADATWMIVDQDLTERKACLQACQDLRNIGANVAGMVVTHLRKKPRRWLRRDHSTDHPTTPGPGASRNREVIDRSLEAIVQVSNS